jgi:hypothetical protein
MATSLLAKLKVNKPPAVKKDMEIRIKGKVNRADAIEKKDKEKAEAIAMEDSDEEQDAMAGNIKKLPSQKPKVLFVDETKNKDFDRATFLKTFQRPKIVNELTPPPQLVQKEQEQEKKEGVKKTTNKGKATSVRNRTIKLKPGDKKTKKDNEAAKEKVVVVGNEEPVTIVIDAIEQPAKEKEVEKEKDAEREKEKEVEKEKVKQPKVTMRRRTKKPIIGIKEGSLGMIKIDDIDIETRLKKKLEAPIVIPASSYYMNNREIFVNFMASLFGKYKKQLADEAKKPATCPSGDEENEFSLMTHQEIVRDYLNVYTPYRGLLLYHGLGSGKTCSSIAIAEGMKTTKQVIIMTPASLQVNYREELKKCGDEIYRKNQFWEFIQSEGKGDELIENLSKVLSISVDYINNQGGAWMVNMSNPSNYESLSQNDKLNINKQIDQMIAYKYRFINYNGLRATKILEMTQNNTINPFDDSVIIVDEAHNLVSRIVNKIGKKKTNIATTLYSLLMKAKNAKIVLLSGTPVINYPNEIAILFNILRGYITTWSLKLDIMAQRQVNTAYLQSLFKPTVLGGHILDLLEYTPAKTTLTVTRNPFGFVNKASAKDGDYSGVKLEIGERGEMNDDSFIKLITQILKKNNINVQANGVSVENYKALPDTLDEFKNYFIESNGQLKNMNMFKRRIIGLTSYFRSAQESLMPKYAKENPADFQVIRIPMSDFQFTIYEEARIQERNQEKNNAKKSKMKKGGTDDLYENTTSTYRIFSRAFCNFVFPRPTIRRPMPDKKNAAGEESDLADAVGINEDVLDAVDGTEIMNRDESFGEGDGNVDGEGAAMVTKSYRERINDALRGLQEKSDTYLTPEALEIYSPKFLHILENIKDEDHVGIHLIYTQFRSLEGIGILKLVLEANGFTQFKIKKTGEVWNLAIPEEDSGKPTFALYTGTETPEEKEIIRNVLNNAWKYVPDTIVGKLKEISATNTMGDIIKVLMITSSGAEGISLKNVRYVHITEPYWHPVRIEQVIGRARRICSHQDLPEELRTVKVFLYLMSLSEKQLKSDETRELRLHDKSRKNNLTPVTTDETLYEIATEKESIATNILTAVKEASIDCVLHSKSNAKEKLQCFTFGSSGSSKFAYKTSYQDEQSDTIADRNKKEITWKAKQIEIDGVKYAYNPITNEVFDLDSYKNGDTVKVGELVISGKGSEATYKLEFI